jgi:anti-sigma factor ChrR (cupin superfamily)
MTKLITYVDSSEVKPFQFRPGSEWSVLFEDAQTGQRAILVKWELGYQMEQVDRHESDEIVFVLSGTFVQNNRASGPGTYIHHRAGSSHQAYTPDGSTFLEVVTGQRARSGRATQEQLTRFRRLATCVQRA